ncbi:Gp15 family bacteriophage protein [Limosilactobacillus reuteri]|uniref:Gp15 family bacteriophage protein n=1 Tax=Limosilactobacillus reuteri TaxID=1598 RepID=UPI002B0601AB|nr:Gp15 family bacteriophage protein [Limosilactobacillus reuteri]
MLSLTEPLGDEFEYQGKKYPIDLSFDNVLKFYDLLDDKRLDDAEKITTAFSMFFGFETNSPDFVIAAFEEITKYISVKPYGNDTDINDENIVRDKRRLYSFKQDAEAIYASFRDQYNINLIAEQGKLHWDEFRALFQGLGPDTYFQRIINIRTQDTKDLKGETLSRAIEAKEYYELDYNKSQEAKEQQVANFSQTLLAWAKS